jgi:hypothetical protein
MSLPQKKSRRSLNLEKDLLLTKDDFGATGASLHRNPEDLGSYLDFLDELWGSGRKEIEKRFYSGQFQL